MTELQKVEAKIAEFDLDGTVREINALFQAKAKECNERLQVMLREAGIFDAFHAVELERIAARKQAESAIKQAHQTLGELKAAAKVLQSLGGESSKVVAIDGGAPDAPPRAKQVTDSFEAAAPE